MEIGSLPLLSMVVALPALGAAVLTRTHRPERARQVALGVLTGTLALAAGILFLFQAGSDGPRFVESWGRVPLLGMHLRLGVDGVSVLALPLTALLGLGLVAAGPRHELDRRTLVALLLTTSGTLGLFCARDLALLLCFWVVSLLAMDALLVRGAGAGLEGRALKTVRGYLLGSTLPLVAAVVLLAVPGWRAGAEAPFGLTELLASGVPAAWRMPVLVLLLLAVAIRMAVVPFHSWLPVLLSRGPVGGALLLINVHVGLYLLVRVAVPLVPEAWALAMPLVGFVGLCGALYGAVLALVQVDLRRMVGFLLVSQAGLMLAGVASMNSQGIAGALLQSVAMGVPLAGLTLVARAIEARTGTADMTRLGGLVRRSPRMAVCFFLLGFASLGFPGSSSFVGEDLLFHGVLGAHPAVALPMLLTAALNGITFLRAFQRTFLGEPAHGPASRLETVEDLLPRERVVALALCGLALVGGFLPGPLLRLSEREVATLAGADATGAHASQDESGGPTGPRHSRPERAAHRR